MSKSKKWIKKQLKLAQKACDKGNYNVAEAELTAVNQRINDELLSLKSTPQPTDIKQIAKFYQLVSALKDFQREAKLKLAIVEQQKERFKKFQPIVTGFQQNHIMEVIKKNKKVFEAFRDRDRTISKDQRFVKILRRWNSYTPLLCLDSIENIGGGYFVAIDGVGIAIDPGINFIKNAFDSRLSLKDINVVVLTHSHVDHTSDFEGLVTLFHEMNEPIYDMGAEPYKISLYTSIGAMNKFSNLISLSYDVFKEIRIINPNNTYKLSNLLSFKTTSCLHNDLFCTNSASCVGLKFYYGRKPRPIFGITSDTGHNPELKKDYADLQGHPVILHIGGVKEKEIDFDKPPDFRIYRYHLGLRGVFNFIFDVKPSIAIISEFGEELRQTRVSISELLEQEFQSQTQVIPADIGLTLQFKKQAIKVYVACSDCKKDVPIQKIACTEDDAKGLKYVCNACRKR